MNADPLEMRYRVEAAAIMRTVDTTNKKEGDWAGHVSRTRKWPPEQKTWTRSKMGVDHDKK